MRYRKQTFRVSHGRGFEPLRPLQKSLRSSAVGGYGRGIRLRHVRSLAQNALGSLTVGQRSYPGSCRSGLRGGERDEFEAHQVCLAERQLLKHVMGGSLDRSSSG